MCILNGERSKRKIKYKSPNHIIQRCHERGPELFGNRVPEIITEIERNILDDARSVFAIDERKDGNLSNYIAIFLTDHGRLAAIPLLIDDEKIFILTVKDVEKDESNPQIGM